MLFLICFIKYFVTCPDRPRVPRPPHFRCFEMTVTSIYHTIVIGPSQRPLPDNTQHSRQTDRHTPGRIRTRSPSHRAAADPHLRPRGPRDQLIPGILLVNHLIVFILRSLLEVSPTSTSMRSLFRLGVCCIANCMLCAYGQ